MEGRGQRKLRKPSEPCHNRQKGLGGNYCKLLSRQCPKQSGFREPYYKNPMDSAGRAYRCSEK